MGAEVLVFPPLFSGAVRAGSSGHFCLRSQPRSISSSTEANPNDREDPRPTRGLSVREMIFYIIVLVIAGVIHLLSQDRASSAEPASYSAACSTPIGDAPSSTGQVEGGDIVRAATPGRAFKDALAIRPGSPARIKMRLSNQGPNTIDQLCIFATLPDHATQSPSVSMTAVAVSSPASSRVTDTASLHTIPGRAACLIYDPASTKLLDRHGSTTQSLSDEILTGGVTVGPLNVPIESVRFVQFQVQIRPISENEPCASSQVL